MDFRAEPCGCTKTIGMSKSREPHFCRHGHRFQYTKALGTKQGADGKLTQRNDPIAECSREQREKVAGALSIISGVGPVDPVHLWDKRLGGCDSADCVVPLTRREHREYEEKELDILGALVAGGYFAELGHVITEHRVSPTVLVERLTGEPYAATSPLIRELDEAKGRIAELEAHVHA
jgi:hypothetical protein